MFRHERTLEPADFGVSDKAELRAMYELLVTVLLLPLAETVSI